MSLKPLCFVLMPFGKKNMAPRRSVDFDAIYHELVKPAVIEAGLEVLRADEEADNGIIHKPMFERLILCDFAIADLTSANANVFYELGVRHAVKPWTTILLFSKDFRLPFDVNMLRALPYSLDGKGKLSNIHEDRGALTKRLLQAQAAHASQPASDSPLFQLLQGYPEIDYSNTDAFRDLVRFSQTIKQNLADACQRRDLAKIESVEKDLGDLATLDAGLMLELFMAYQKLGSWGNMIRLVNGMRPDLRSTVKVQEQYALALNRLGQWREAEQVLKRLMSSRGSSSEALGILGRIYKDQWEAAQKMGDDDEARGWLNKAIEAYLDGFEFDWRDPYPGINAISLLEILGDQEKRAEILPIVEYAVERKLADTDPDYWDYATKLELLVIKKEKELATDTLANVLALATETWKLDTSIRNLRLVRRARLARGENIGWDLELEDKMKRKAMSMNPA